MQYKRANAMTLRSDEIIWGNTHKDSLILLIASTIAFSSTILLYWLISKRMLHNIPTGAKYFYSEMIMHAYSLF